MSLDGPEMADGATSVGFPGRQGFKRVNTTIRDEVRCLITELQKDREANHISDKGDVGSKTTSHLRKKELKNQSCAFILLGQSR